MHTIQAIPELFRTFQENGTLVRLSIIKEKGNRLNIPCRILHFEAESNQVSVYHVDEKIVYSIKLNEIEDYKVN